MNKFELKAPYSPMGDQIEAIKTLVDSLQDGHQNQTLLGVTGSGKTFTMANITAQLNRPTLVIAHNKTLAAQLAQEFQEFFPNNAVHYFVSYYDYYQPEAYVPKTGTYIEKEAMINAEIERLRLAATESLLTRRDVLIVASVSCIYSIGDPREYGEYVVRLDRGKEYKIEHIIEQLTFLHYSRSSADFRKGMFRVMGDTLDIFPASEEFYYSLEFFGDELEKITAKFPFESSRWEVVPQIALFPAKHSITSRATIDRIVPLIRAELAERLAYFESQNNFLQAERLKTKVEYDIEMMTETGYVSGIENYSFYMSGRDKENSPATLMDFFPADYLTFIDESHITLPQIRGMHAGDRARKQNLIENGFRLPSAFENRPLQFEEFNKKVGQTVYVSATPADYEVEKSEVIARQIIRPTGLLDPTIEIKDMEFMVDDLLENIRAVKAKDERVLITTLTKKSAEELTEFLGENGILVSYLHSEVDTLDRLEVLRDLRTGKIDVIVGVNLLREGLDLPEVSFIGILDAEKQGFLRSTSSLLQIVGRASRNASGRVVMYSHQKVISPAMQQAIKVIYERRAIQDAYNKEHGIEPKTIISRIKDLGLKKAEGKAEIKLGISLEKQAKKLELQMDIAATALDFEKATILRDQIIEIRDEIKKRDKKSKK